MNRVLSGHFFLVAIIFLLFSCKNANKGIVPDDNNPIYQSDSHVKELTKMIKDAPTDASLYYQRGKLLFHIKQDSLAVKDFKRAVALDSNKAEYYSAVGDVLFEDKDLEGSVQWLQKALSKNPEDVKARLKIAKMFLYLRDFPKVFEQVNLVLRKDVYNGEGYFLKGMAFKEMKDTSHAISSFQTCLEQHPDYREAAVQLGLIYSNRNDSVALKYLTKALNIDSADVTPIFARGVYYQQNKEFEKAKAEYHKCIVKNTHFIDAYFNMGSILMQQDSVEKALRSYDMATKIEPDNPSAYYDRGVCYEMLGKLAEAAVDYRRALLLDTSYASPKKALKDLGLLPTGKKTTKKAN